MRRPGRCPTCGKVWLIIKKHPNDADVLLYRCPKGHAFKRTVVLPPAVEVPDGV